MKKLSRAQIAALRAMPFDVAMWGGRPLTGWPGPFTASTLDALRRAGLARTAGVKGRPFSVRYRLTDAGAAALLRAGGAS